MWVSGKLGEIDLTVALGPGCYALGKRNEVLYVGQSRVLIRRLYAHAGAVERAARGKHRQGDRLVPFNQIAIWPCEIAELDEVEQDLIKLYQPPYNIRHRAKVTLEQAGFNPSQVKVPVSLSVKFRRLCAEAAPEQPRLRRL